MEHTYDLKWLTDKFDMGEQLNYLFFWGHSAKPGAEVGKFCFSQWFELPFVVDGVLYKTAEHWMMAHKALLFEDKNTYNKIIAANTPVEAKKLGREILGFDEILWNKQRSQIVIMGNIHKFNQHKPYLEYLMNTNDRVLVEASPTDKIWGIGLSADAEHIDNPYFWNGENLLGFALMDVRDFFNEFGAFNYLENVVLPPWKIHPDIHPFDLFWRMGGGEDTIGKFVKYYDQLSEKDKLVLKLTYPTPHNWRDFYN